VTEILHLSVHLRCGACRVFEMFTLNRLVESWLIKPYSPRGHAEIQPHLGGKYELLCDPEHKDQNSTFECKVTAIVPDRLLAFDWKGPVEYKEIMNIDPLNHVVVSFFTMGEASTEVHLVHSGWGNSKDWDEARGYFQQAWSSAFKKLENICNE